MDEYKKTALKGLKKLEQIEIDLKEGRTYLSITRLIVLKKLCVNQNARHRFAKYLCDKTYQACKGNKNISADFKSLIEEALQLMEMIIVHNESGKKGYPKQAKKKLETIYQKLIAFQNETRSGHFGVQIRTINSMDLFRIERGIKCFLFEDESAGYEVGREYAERYNSSYGTGLIPESLKYVHDIVEYWRGYLRA